MTDTARALELLESLRIQHYYCEDPWYSCPLATDGCCDDTCIDCARWSFETSKTLIGPALEIA
jgi:hypothetical protein